MDLKLLNKIAALFARENPNYNISENFGLSLKHRNIILTKVKKIINYGLNNDLKEFISNMLELKMYIYGDPANDKPGEIEFSFLTKSFHEDFMLSESIWKWIEDIVYEKSTVDDFYAMELITAELEEYYKQNGIIN